MARTRSEKLASTADQGIDLVTALTRFGSAYSRWVRLCVPTTPADGITAPRLSLLGLLATQGQSIIMSELADKLGVSSRNITVLVDGLERENLVRRRSHPTDRRATLVEISPAGEALAARLIGPHREAVAQLFHALSFDEATQLIGTISKLNARLAELGVTPMGGDLGDPPPRS